MDIHQEHEMEQHLEYHKELEKVRDRDFIYDWVSSSAFLFYLTVFCVLAFAFGACFQLYKHSYKGHPDVKVQESTLYTPKYK